MKKMPSKACKGLPFCNVGNKENRNKNWTHHDQKAQKTSKVPKKRPKLAKKFYFHVTLNNLNKFIN